MRLNKAKCQSLLRYYSVAQVDEPTVGQDGKHFLRQKIDFLHTFTFFVIMLFSSLFHFILGIGCLQKNCQVVNGSGSSGTENFENKEGDLKETFLISSLLRKR